MNEGLIVGSINAFLPSFAGVKESQCLLTIPSLGFDLWLGEDVITEHFMDMLNHLTVVRVHICIPGYWLKLRKLQSDLITDCWLVIHIPSYRRGSRRKWLVALCFLMLQDDIRGE